MNQYETMVASCATFAATLADCARHLLAKFEQAPMIVEMKSDRTFVTEMDARIETQLRAMISSQWPGHGIIGEEEKWHAPDAEWVWVLDPIDGTAAYIAGVPVYGTLIALAFRGIPVIGIIDIPKLDLRWTGIAGQSTTLNGTPCKVQAPESLSTAILSTSNPEFYSESERSALQTMRDATSWRIYGGAALSYGRLAEGRLHLSMDSGLKIYDFAPFRPIIEGAGGIISDWNGKPITLSSGPRILAAADVKQHQEALSLIAIP
jgi:histidinol phosphatase-like enzyme (inositol monophosphatase family)